MRPKVEIDEMVREFLDLGLAVEKLVTKNEGLEKEMLLMDKRLLAFSAAEKSTNEEMMKLQDIVSTHQRILLQHSQLQDENQELKTEVNLQKDKSKQKEQECLDRAEKSIQHLAEIEKHHTEEIERIRKEAEHYASSEISRYEKLLEQSRYETELVRKEKISMEKQKQAEIVRMKLEYDSKMQRLHQKQLTQSMSSAGSVSMRNDIFRKKLEHYQGEAEQRIQNLRTKCSELEHKYTEQKHHIQIQHKQHADHQKKLQEQIQQHEQQHRKLTAELRKNQNLLRQLQEQTRQQQEILEEKEKQLYHQRLQGGSSKRKRTLFNADTDHLSQI